MVISHEQTSVYTDELLNAIGQCFDMAFKYYNCKNTLTVVGGSKKAHVSVNTDTLRAGRQSLRVLNANYMTLRTQLHSLGVTIDGGLLTPQNPGILFTFDVYHIQNDKN